MGGLMNGWMDEWVDGWVVGGWKVGHMGGWMNGWWVDGLISFKIHGRVHYSPVFVQIRHSQGRPKVRPYLHKHTYVHLNPCMPQKPFSVKYKTRIIYSLIHDTFLAHRCYRQMMVDDG